MASTSRAPRFAPPGSGAPFAAARPGSWQRSLVERAADTPWAPPLLVALVTFAAFLPALQNEFLVWDDYSNLLANPDYRGLGWANLRWMFTTILMGHWIPLTWITFGADYLVWGMNPFGYHLTNLLLHTGGAVVFYFVALSLLSAATPGRTRTALHAGAVAAALFFAIHPLRVESVAWVTERRDVLSGLGFLLTILAYLKAVAATGARRRAWLLGSAGCYVLAVCSKAIVMTLPLVLILLDAYPLRRLGGGWRQWTAPVARRVWAEKIPYVALALGSAGMSIYALRSFSESPAARPLTQRAGVALYGLGFYVWKTAIPLWISPLYEMPSVVQPLAPSIVLSAFAVAALTVGLLLLRRRWPAGLAVWISYAVLLAPVSGIVQSGPQIVAARYSYLPALGWALLVGAALCLACDAAARGRLAPVWVWLGAVGVTVCFVGLGILTREHVRVWHDTETLWAYTVSVEPASSVARSNLGAALGRRGRLTEAHEHLQAAVQLSPDYVDARVNLAEVLRLLGRPGEAKAARMDVGTVLVHRGRFKEAAAVFQRIVEAEPGDAMAHNNLGVALLFQNDLEAAIEHFERAVQLDPGFEEARSNLGSARARRKPA